MCMYWQEHLFRVRCGHTNSTYATNYAEKSATVAGRWLLKQQGFGPVEGQQMVNVTDVVFLSTVGNRKVHGVTVGVILLLISELCVLLHS